MRIHTTHTRDAALRDLNRITRWLLAGSIVLTGVLSDVAASAFSGKATKHRGARESGLGGVSARGDASPTFFGKLRAPTHAPKAVRPSPVESAPDPESAHESAPAAEPTHESQRAQEPVHEAAPEPEPEPSRPAVSGGS